jgi:nicotinate-nucleotide adenylyltransferase
LIGIFGGSFDPPHQGHLGVIQEFWKNFPFADELIVVPNRISPLKKGKAVDNIHIVSMLSSLFMEGRIQRTSISDIELTREGPSYTIDTVNSIHQLHPFQELYLLIGDDSLKFFHTWKDYQKILSIAKLVVFQRTLERSKQISEDIIYINNPVIEVSSTQIKNLLSLKEKSKYLPPSVYQYIIEHQLY